MRALLSFGARLRRTTWPFCGDSDMSSFWRRVAAWTQASAASLLMLRGSRCECVSRSSAQAPLRRVRICATVTPTAMHPVSLNSDGDQLRLRLEALRFGSGAGDFSAARTAGLNNWGRLCCDEGSEGLHLRADRRAHDPRGHRRPTSPGPQEETTLRRTLRACRGASAGPAFMQQSQDRMRELEERASKFVASVTMAYRVSNGRTVTSLRSHHVPDARTGLHMPAGSNQEFHINVLHRVFVETSASSPGGKEVSQSMSLQGRTAADKRSATRSGARASTGQNGVGSSPYGAEHDTDRRADTRLSSTIGSPTSWTVPEGGMTKLRNKGNVFVITKIMPANEKKKKDTHVLELGLARQED